MNDCTLDAADIGDIAADIADAWASGFGIYPALETASAPAGSVPGGPSARRGASRRLAVAGLVLGAIGLFALIADVAIVIAHG